MVRLSERKTATNGVLPVMTIVIVSIVICFSFYIGTMTGFHIGSSGHRGCSDSTDVEEWTDAEILDLVKRKADEEITNTANRRRRRFSPSLSPIATGVVKTSKADFFGTFDYGTPMDNDSGNGEVLIIFSGESSLPANRSVADAAVFFDSGGDIPSVGAVDATRNCDELKVVMSKNRDRTECMVLLDDFESYHIQRWLRLNDRNKIENNLPLRHAGRGQLGSKGSNAYPSPENDHILQNRKILLRYFDALDDLISQIGPILKRIAKKNTIIVMTCNFGQSALLENFACSARSRGFDLSNVLVFATDEETRDVARGVGLEAFYDEKIFGTLPKNEAKGYMDRTFAAMMGAKVICVQLVNFFGYDLVFQDVDIVWYQDPIEIFHEPTHPYYPFDIIFQDDGAHTARYAPFSANTGFYFVRYNARTRELFSSFLLHGEMVLQKKSHQQALTAILAEHTSKFGLRVKIIPLDDDGFPGGWHYHARRKKQFMKDIAKGDVIPKLFHMSWTRNKDNKLLFMRQMGMWYVNHDCVDKKVADLMLDGQDDLVAKCCAKEPIVSCHYRDKPSIIPCTDSPPIDKGQKSFW